MTLSIKELERGAPVLDQEALVIFQKQWRTYQRLLELDYLSHKKVLEILRAILSNEFKSQFSLLDLACGDAFGMVQTLSGTKIGRYLGIDMSMPALELAAERLDHAAFPVELIHGDIIQGVEQIHDPFDVVWCGLCLHHLASPDKQRALSAIRIKTRKTCLIYEPSRRNNEDRDEFMARFLRENQIKWDGLSQDEWTEISKHVTECDLPEKEADWCAMGLEAGFARAEKIFNSPTDFAALYRYDA